MHRTRNATYSQRVSGVRIPLLPPRSLRPGIPDSDLPSRASDLNTASAWLCHPAQQPAAGQLRPGLTHAMVRCHPRACTAAGWPHCLQAKLRLPSRQRSDLQQLSPAQISGGATRRRGSRERCAAAPRALLPAGAGSTLCCRLPGGQAGLRHAADEHVRGLAAPDPAVMAGSHGLSARAPCLGGDGGGREGEEALTGLRRSCVPTAMLCHASPMRIPIVHL